MFGLWECDISENVRGATSHGNFQFLLNVWAESCTLPRNRSSRSEKRFSASVQFWTVCLFRPDSAAPSTSLSGQHLREETRRAAPRLPAVATTRRQAAAILEAFLCSTVEVADQSNISAKRLQLVQNERNPLPVEARRFLVADCLRQPRFHLPWRGMLEKHEKHWQSPVTTHDASRYVEAMAPTARSCSCCAAEAVAARHN